MTAIDSAVANDYEKMDSLASRFSVLGSTIQKSVKTIVDYKIYPNVVLPIEIDDSLTLVNLPLDDSGGTLTVHCMHAYHYDTIRISKFIVFHNCFPDTTRSGIAWYKNYNADTSKKLELLRSKKYRDRVTIKDCKTNIPNSVTLTINQNPFTAKTRIRKRAETAMGWYHGHKKMSKRKERKYEQARSAGKPYIYFAAGYHIDQYCIAADVILK